MSPFPIGWSLSISERFVFSSAKLLFITSLNNICLMMVQPKYFVNKLPTQTKLLISAFQGPLAEKLYLSLFVVCSFRYGNPRPNLHFFFNIYKLYWPSTTKYQTVPHNTDPVPSCINQYHQVPTITTLWRSVRLSLHGSVSAGREKGVNYVSKNIFETSLWPNCWIFSRFLNCFEELLSCGF